MSRLRVKGIIFDLKKYAVHDGPGIRTTVFLKGCPLDCWWCHNPESRKLEPQVVERKSAQNSPGLSYRDSREIIGREATVAEVLREIEKDVIFYDQSGGGVTFSGGEPLLQIDFLEALLRECREREIHTAVDTTGYASWEQLERIFPFTDLFLYDLKLLDDRLHRRYTGVSNRLILENLEKLLSRGARVVIRIPLIPDFTDSRENLLQIARYLRKFPQIKRIDLLPYNPIGEAKYAKLGLELRAGKHRMQSDDRLEELRRLVEGEGFDVRIGG